MIFGLEIGLAIVGLIALFRGKLPLTQQRFVSGVPARLLGLVALAPFPIAFGAAFVFGFQAGLEGRVMNESVKTTLMIIEAALVIFSALIVFGVGFAISETPPPIPDLDEPEDDRSTGIAAGWPDSEPRVRPFNAKAIFTFKSDRKYRVYGDGEMLYFIHLAGQWDLIGNLAGIDPQKLRDMDRMSPKDMVGNHANDFTVPLEDAASATIDAPSFWGGHGKHVGSWQLVLKDGTKWNLQFEEMPDMRRAVESLSQLLGEKITVNANWDEVKQKYR